MTKQKLTDWYPGKTKPVRNGVYQRAYDGGTLIRYCYFDGFAFGECHSEAQLARYVHQLFGAFIQQNLPWRGVSK